MSEDIVTELEKQEDLGAPLQTVPDFTYICPDCKAEGKESSTCMVSPPVKLITRMPIYDSKGNLLSDGKRSLLTAMVCENNHEHIHRREFDFNYNMGEGNGEAEER